MTEEKQKNKRTEVVWTSENLSESIHNFLGSLGVSTDTEAKHGTWSEPVGSATSADVTLNFSVGEVAVHALDSSENLLEADLHYIGEIDFEVTGDTAKTVKLGQRKPGINLNLANPFTWLSSKRPRLDWNIGLSPTVPVVLNVNGGVGSAKLDLAGLQINGFVMHSGVGQFKVNLPGRQYTAHIEGGVGELDIALASGADVNAIIKAGTGEIKLSIGADTALIAEIHGGVGEVSLHLPEDAAVHIEANIGLGDVSVPSRYRKVSGGDGGFMSMGGRGVWETDNYATAARKINVTYEGGVGSFRVR